MNHKRTLKRSGRSILRTAVSILLVLVLFGTSFPIYPGLKVEKASASTNLRIEPSEINNELGEKTTISFSFNAADKGQEEHDIKINLAIPGANGGVPELKELITSGTYRTKNAQGEYIVHEVEWDGKINGQPLPEGRYYIAISPADYNGIGVYYGQIGSFEIVNSKQPSPPASIEIKAGSTGQVVVSGTSALSSVVELEVRDQNGALIDSYNNIAVNQQGQWSKSVALDADKIFQLSARSHQGDLTSSYSIIQEVMRYSAPAFPVTWGELAAYYYKASTLDQVEQKVADIAAWNGMNTLASSDRVTGSSIVLINPQMDRLLQQGDVAQFTAEAINDRLNIVNPMWSDYVDPARGDFSYYTDELYLQAIMPLSFGLSYLSRNELEGSVGLGWLHSYEWKLTEVEGKQELLQPDGSHFEFIPLANGAYLAPRGTDWTLQKSGAGHVLKDVLGTSYAFQANGLLASITDTSGNKITLEYQGERLYKVSTSGASITLSYNAEGRLSTVTDHTGRNLSYQYNAAGDMVAFTDVDGSVTAFTYDDAHHVIAVTDPAQTAEMRVVYDDQMRVIDFTDYYGSSEQVAYDGSIAPVVSGEATEQPGQPSGPTSIHPDNARDIPESNIVILSGSMNNIHNAPPYKIVPGLKPVITDYLASLTSGITEAIEAYKQKAGGQVSSIEQIQQKIAASSGTEAVVVRTGYLNLEENVTFGRPNKPVVLIADGINTNKEITVTVYGDLILENGLNGNTKLNVCTKRVNGKYGNFWAKSTIHLNNDSDVQVEDTLYAGALTYNSGSLAVEADQLIVQGDLSINTEVEMNIAKQMVLGGIVSNNLVANLNITGGDLFVRDQVSVNNQMSVTAGGVFAIGGDMTANKTPAIRIGVGNGRTILNYTEPEAAAAGKSAVAAQGVQALFTENSALAGYAADSAQSASISSTIATISETKRTNALKDTTTYVWGSQFLLSELKSADGSTISFAYDDNERIAEVIDGRGYRSQYAYDARGNQLQSIDGNGESIVARYNEQNRPVEVIDALGRLSAYKYDSSGNLIGGVNALGEQWKTLRDSRGIPTQITNERGDTTRYVNNNAGFVEKVIDPSGYELTIERDELNRVTAVSDSEGIINEMSYDAKDRATEMSDALKQSVQREYDANGNLISVMDVLGSLTTYDYDVFRHVATTDALGEQSVFQYDAVGNLIKATDRNGGSSSYHYDSLGRVVKEIDPDGNTFSFTYDSAGNQLSYTDGEGSTSAYTYNAFRTGANLSGRVGRSNTISL